jgi:mRNA-degrading endonuclease RelE of RelBE toxin-antitoxin system
MEATFTAPSHPVRNCRILYEIVDADLIVTVITIGTRQDV